MSLKFKLEAVVLMLPENEKGFLSGCEVEHYEYELIEGKDEGDEISDYASWSMPGGFIEFLSEQGCKEGKFQLICEVEITYYYCSYLGEGDSQIEYSNWEIKRLA